MTTTFATLFCIGGPLDGQIQKGNRPFFRHLVSPLTAFGDWRYRDYAGRVNYETVDYELRKFLHADGHSVEFWVCTHTSANEANARAQQLYEQARSIITEKILYCIGGILDGHVRRIYGDQFREAGEFYELVHFDQHDGLPLPLMFWVKTKMSLVDARSRAVELHVDAAVLQDEQIINGG